MEITGWINFCSIFSCYPDVFAYDYQGTRSFLMKTLDTGRPISDRTASTTANPQPFFQTATDNTAHSEKLSYIFKQLKAYEKGKSRIPPEQTSVEQAVEKGKVDEVTPDLFEPFNIDNSLSAGWDKRICVWDVETGILLDKFRDPQCPDPHAAEMATEGEILDMAYSPELSRRLDDTFFSSLGSFNQTETSTTYKTLSQYILFVYVVISQQFACACSDWTVYIRRATIVGERMTLLHQIIGHCGAVSSVIYCPSEPTLPTSDSESDGNGRQPIGQWITGSDDGTIRIWLSNDLDHCRMKLHTGGPVACMAINPREQILVAGIHKDIKSYDLNSGYHYHTYTGHSDVIRWLLVLPEKEEYITAGADGQLRVWRAWKNIKPVGELNTEERSPNTSGFKTLPITNPAAAIGAAARMFAKSGIMPHTE
ncbi:WD domain, G-beta repeat protein [Opisthorchis viverrini]|uniref:WD domain, G-beta repeat protein n=1 Tax=Opisthorchis viverrini TaxID=6198 RepID=A0A1S8XA49_OPIVI|nr:WD domain, G-beta repeat protein [Opisthorchis viverrini]